MVPELFYFDHNATTPMAPEVLQATVGALSEAYGNASSIHRTGQYARQLLETARRQIAALVGCDSKEIVFTSGGTEADNLAILGSVRAVGRHNPHVITTTIEHAAVLGACGQLQREGVAVTYVPVDPSGIVAPDDIRKALRPETALVTVMHANNELGTIQPVAAIARIAREAGVPFHSDGVQATGRLPLNLRESGVDLYSMSAHKLYGPKGVGALYIRGGMKLQPLLFGGRHEKGHRPGTENVAGAVGFGRAAALALDSLDLETRRIEVLRNRLEQGIAAAVPDIRLNAAGSPRLPNTTNISFDGIGGEAMVIALDLRGFAVSTGSACSSGAVEPSHVLTAIGMSARDARSTLRFSLGRSNDERQVDELVEAVADCAEHLRKLSPDYAHA